MTAPRLWYKGEDNSIESIIGADAVWDLTPAYMAGKVGRAFQCDVASGAWAFHVPIASIPANIFVPTGNFSIRFWIRLDNLFDRFIVFNFPYNFGIWIDGGTIYYTTSSLFATTGTISDNDWHEVLFSYANGAKKFYLDGVDITGDSMDANVIAAPTNDMVWGNAYVYFGGARSFDGGLDEIRIYDAAITPNNKDVERVFIDLLHEYIRNNVVGPFSIQYGGPGTLTFSSEHAQVLSCDESGDSDLVFLDEDFEILQGSR